MVDVERNSLRIDKHGHHFTSRERRGRSHFAFESPADARSASSTAMNNCTRLCASRQSARCRPEFLLGNACRGTIVRRIVRVNRPIENLPIKCSGLVETETGLGKVLIAPKDMVVAFAEEAILPPTARGTARLSSVQGKEKAMVGAVRITKVDALRENFAY